MVSHPGAPLGAHSPRPLGTPKPIEVRADASGRPLAVRKGRWPGPRSVVCVQDCWRIDDEWWRERPISRLYFTVVLDDNILLTLYHDLHAGTWFEQRG